MTGGYPFEGVLYRRGDDGYESARVDPIFNGRKPDRFPVAILEAASAADVVAGVRLAIANAWKISVRAGGHSWAAWSVRDEALLIDLGGMRELRIDVENHLAIVSPSLQGGQHLAPFLADTAHRGGAGHRWCSHTHPLPA